MSALAGRIRATLKAHLVAESGRSAVGAIAAAAIVTGAIAVPPRVLGQTTSGAPYRLVLPQGPGPHPALLFVSGCSGFTPDEAPLHYGRVADEFAARGYVVLFVDYLGARERKRCGGMVSPSEVAEDILAAVAYARTRPFVRPSEIDVIGWSRGGSGVLAMIASLPEGSPPPIRAAVAYYPECYVATPWAVRMPLLMLLAGRDELSPTPACEELVKRLGAAQPIEIRLYPKARHAFDVPDLPPLLRRVGGAIGHDPEAAAAAREEVKRFLGR